MSHQPDQLPKSWRTGNMIRGEQGGTREIWIAKIEELQKILIAECMAEHNIGLTAARRRIQKDMVREVVSGGHNVLAVSPKAYERMDKRPQFPGLQDGWKTGKMLSKEGPRSSTKWNAEMEQLRTELIKDIAEGIGVSMNKASAMVEANLVGMRQPPSGPAALAASPEALRLMSAPPKDLPKLDNDWLTGHGFRKARGEGDQKKYIKMMEALARELTEDISNALEIDEKAAAAIVDKNLVGWRQSNNGKPALAASPDAQPIIDERYRFREHVKKRGEGPPQR